MSNESEQPQFPNAPGGVPAGPADAGQAAAPQAADFGTPTSPVGGAPADATMAYPTTPQPYGQGGYTAPGAQPAYGQADASYGQGGYGAPQGAQSTAAYGTPAAYPQAGYPGAQPTYGQADASYGQGGYGAPQGTQPTAAYGTPAAYPQAGYPGAQPAYGSPQGPAGNGSGKSNTGLILGIGAAVAALIIGLLVYFLFFNGGDDKKSAPPAPRTSPTAVVTEEATTEPTQEETAQPTEAPGDSPEQEAIKIASDAKSAKWGETVDMGNKILVTVSEPKDYTVGKYATDPVYPGQDRALEVTVTIKNDTSSKFDTIELDLDMVTEGKKADGIVDFDDPDLEFIPMDTIEPGDTITYKLAFWVAPGKPVQFYVDNWLDDYRVLFE